MPRRVLLVGVDGSSRSADAVAFAAWLARHSQARLLLANVYSLDRAAEDFAGGVNLARVLREGAEAALERARLTAGEELEVQTRALPGESPAATLRSLAVAEGAALVVLGSTHVSRLGRIHPGSTAERLLHDGPCPVAIVPRGYSDRAPETIVRIGVAHDRSATARTAWEAAVALAGATHADVMVMMAADFAWNGTPAHATGPEWAMTRDAVLATVRSELDATVAATPENVEARGVVLEGDIADELANQTRRLDVLFMGSRGLTPLQSVLAGGVSGRVLREAHCPVIITPARVSDVWLDDEVTAAPAAQAAEPPARGAESVLRFLHAHGIECAVTEHAETFTAAAEARATAVSADRTAKTVLVRDGDGYVMALIPASRMLDLAKLRRLARRPDLQLAAERDIAADFPQFEVGALPPFGALLGTPEFIDDRLFVTPRVLCNAGDHRHSMVIDVHELRVASGAQVGDLAREP